MTNEDKNNCLACDIQNGKIKVPGGSILNTRYFDAHQDFGVPIPGFVIIASKRHIQSVDEFIKEEREDFMEVLCRIREAIRKAAGINTGLFHTRGRHQTPFSYVAFS